MANPHITYVQWQESQEVGGKWHEPGETGDYSHEPHFDRLVAEGAIGFCPVLNPDFLPIIPSSGLASASNFPFAPISAPEPDEDEEN